MSLRYSVVALNDPTDGRVIHVARQSARSHKNSSLTRRINEAATGASGRRYDEVRLLRSRGIAPVQEVKATNLDKDSANTLIDGLREQQGVRCSRRGVSRPRVHQQADPDSPDLDPTPIYYVYELIRPDTNKVFYVGKGSDRHCPRIGDHIRKAKKGKKGHKFSVIRKLLKMGLSPAERRIAEKLTESEALKLEVEHISSIGLNLLTNDADGGQTAPTGDDHWTRKYPEKVLRGERHPWNRDPDYARRNIDKMQAALKANPSNRPRGDSHGMAKLSRAQVDEIRTRYQKGLKSASQVTGKQLAVEYGVTPAQISAILRGCAWGLPSLIQRHGNAKLTTEQIASIPGLLADGKTQKNIAHELGVSHSLINYYAKKIVVELVVN